DYIKEKGYSDILVPLYNAYDSVNDIDFSDLPSSFILKGNNGCETNIIVRDKSLADMDEIKKEVSSWCFNNQVVLTGKEWCYKHIPFKITCEELLVNNESEGNEIDDYKFLCFNGRVEFIWVDKNRFTGHTRTFFDRKWGRVNVTSDRPVSKELIQKPWGFDKMLEIAEDIGKDFPFARVDFYSLNNRIYFGEITFYPWSGYVKFTPDSFDLTLGNKFILPRKFK
ncbi:ATP-grasp fold amidoligase family protein, partial [Psychrobacter sp. Ps6]